MRGHLLIGCCFPVLLATSAAGAEPVLATHLGNHQLHIDEDSLELHLEHSDAERKSWRPHSWLSHTVKNLDLELAHNQLGLGFAFDVRKQKAFISLGKSDGFGVATDVRFHNGMATLSTKVNLPMSGTNFKFELPDITVIPRSHKGEYYMEYHVPILSGNIDDLFQRLGTGDARSAIRFF